MLSIEPRRPLLRALSHKRVDFSWKQGLYAFYFKIGRRREICLTCCPMSFYLQCLQNYRESKLTVFLLFSGFFFKPFFTRYLGNGIFAMSLNILNIVSTGNAFLAIPGNKCPNSEIGWALDHDRDMYKCAPATLQYSAQLWQVPPSKFSSELLCTNNSKHEKP